MSERFFSHASHALLLATFCMKTFMPHQTTLTLDIPWKTYHFRLGPTFLKLLAKILGRFLIVGVTIFDNIWETLTGRKTRQQNNPATDLGNSNPLDKRQSKPRQSSKTSGTGFHETERGNQSDPVEQESHCSETKHRQRVDKSLKDDHTFTQSRLTGCWHFCFSFFFYIFISVVTHARLNWPHHQLFSPH